MIVFEPVSKLQGNLHLYRIVESFELRIFQCRAVQVELKYAGNIIGEIIFGTQL